MARISREDGGGEAAAPTSWLGWKERGKSLFQNENYEASLNAYTQALRPEYHCPASEQQVLWSNIVACRLKIGGSRAQAEAAVEAAKQCVALNESWAKGHVRLASAYIALGDHSNDACNALQRAVQLDPGNRTARDMLVRELRRDRASRLEQPSNSTASTAPPSAPLEDLDDRVYPPRRNERQYSTTRQRNDDVDHGRPHPPPRDGPNDDIDNDLTWLDKLQFYAQRAKHWYISQSDDVKGILKVFVGLIVLYVAFGGRFGLEYLSSSATGSNSNAGGRRGNVYEDFYHERRQRQRQDPASSRDYYDPYAGRHDLHHNDPYYRYDGSRHRPGNSWSFGGGNSFATILMLGAVAYVAQRNGINPLQALFFANMAMGGRRRHGFHGGGWRPGGMMMGGFPRGGGRRRW